MNSKCLRKNRNYIEAISSDGSIMASENINMPAKRTSGVLSGRTYGEEFAAGNLCTCAFADDGEQLIRAN